MARPRLVSDEEILTAARAVFLEHGTGASTQLVADEVGLSQPALFKRLGKKLDLVVAALAPRDYPEWVARAEAGPDERDAVVQLRELLVGINEFLTVFAPCFATLMSSGLPVHEMMRKWKGPSPVLAHRALKGWLERAHALRLLHCPDAENATFMVMGSVRGRVMEAHMFRTGDVPSIDVESILQMLMHGLAPREAL